mmetsp:Transcript_64284/g.207096  ORF Transcript_64284/g.207096 Transcript_64284/m.207096 type:complete len:205 (+) Transcript_64284:1257-1871(+)
MGTWRHSSRPMWWTQRQRCGCAPCRRTSSGGSSSAATCGTRGTLRQCSSPGCATRRAASSPRTGSGSRRRRPAATATRESRRLFRATTSTLAPRECSGPCPGTSRTSPRRSTSRTRAGPRPSSWRSWPRPSFSTMACSTRGSCPVRSSRSCERHGGGAGASSTLRKGRVAGGSRLHVKLEKLQGPHGRHSLLESLNSCLHSPVS